MTTKNSVLIETLDQAIEIYMDALESAYGTTVGVVWPANYSNMDKNGRWTLRNIKGFLAYVTSRGKVLDSRFQQIGGIQ